MQKPRDLYELHRIESAEDEPYRRARLSDWRPTEKKPKKGFTHEILEIINKARDYDKTKSITTACAVCDMLNKWADTFLVRELGDEQD